MSSTLSRSEGPAEAAIGRRGLQVAGAHRLGGRSLRLPVIAGLVVIGAAAAVWGWSSRSGMAPAGPDLYKVARRSFPVILREKGELKAAKSVDIKSEVEGRSTIIWLIEEGNEVKQGDLLVKLASDQIIEKVQSEAIREATAAAAAAAAEKEHEILLDQNASDLRKAMLALTMAQLEMDKYLKGDWEQTKLDVGLELQRAKMVQERAHVELEASRELHDKNFMTDGDLYRDMLAALEADIAVKKAELSEQTTEAYTHTKDLQQRESDLEEAGKELERVEKSNSAKEAKSAAELEAKQAEWTLTKERLAKYREQQGKCEIRAPQDGLVVYEGAEGGHRFEQRQIAEGAEVYERQTIIKLPDPSVMVVTVRIHEAKTDKIAKDQRATVEVEGLPGQVFAGTVTKIATLADSQNTWLNPELKEYETEITLDSTDAPLKPGVTARADIVVAELENVLAVPIQTVFTKAGHHFVFRKKGGDAEPIEVEVGRSSDEFVEIGSGLAEGDAIMLAVPQAVRQRLPEVEPNSVPGNGAEKALATPGSLPKVGQPVDASQTESGEGRRGAAEERPAGAEGHRPAAEGQQPGGAGQQPAAEGQRSGTQERRPGAERRRPGAEGRPRGGGSRPSGGGQGGS